MTYSRHLYIKEMKKSWLYSDSICLAKGEAVALNLMFETKKDHEIFLIFWNKYLGNMATLINYHLSPTGWTILFKTKSENEIKTAYHEFRSTSKKAKKDHYLNEVSRILSEHFRIFLSQYARRMNANNGRKGTLVLQRFSKYILDKKKDFERFFNMITNQEHTSSQVQKYKANESKYDLKNEMSNESVWKVGNRLYEGLDVGFREFLREDLLRPENPVLRNFLKITQKQNQTNNSS